MIKDLVVYLYGLNTLKQKRKPIINLEKIRAELLAPKINLFNLAKLLVNYQGNANQNDSIIPVRMAKTETQENVNAQVTVYTRIRNCDYKTPEQGLLVFEQLKVMSAPPEEESFVASTPSSQRPDAIIWPMQVSISAIIKELDDVKTVRDLGTLSHKWDVFIKFLTLELRELSGGGDRKVVQIDFLEDERDERLTTEF
ncbi:hypothetical protein STEG23_004479 [Scotinomys teguina]